MAHEVRGVVALAKGAPVSLETIARPRPRPGRGARARPGVRGVPHRPPLPRGRASTTTSPSCSATRPPGVVEAVGPDVTVGGARGLRRPQLAGGVRRVPVVSPGPALVLLRHPQRHPEDDAGRRHRPVPGARHRRLRREDARGRGPVHQGRPGRARPEAAGLLGLRRDGRPRARPCSPARSAWATRWPSSAAAAWAAPPSPGSVLAGASQVIAVDLDPEQARAGPALRRHPRRRRLGGATRWRRSGRSPAATAPTCASRRWATPR